jgi:DNA relaxase NicK
MWEEFGGAARITRVDVAFDDVALTPAECERATKGGRVEMLTSELLRTDYWRGEHEGKPTGTWYVGNRKDRSLLVCLYDRRGFNRLEVRLYREHAEAAALVVEEHGVEGLADWVRSVLRGWVYIGHPHWRSFLGPGGMATVARRTHEENATAVRVVTHVERALAKTLARYVALRGWPALQRVVAEGARDLRSREWADLGLSPAQLDFAALTGRAIVPESSVEVLQ